MSALFLYFLVQSQFESANSKLLSWILDYLVFDAYTAPQSENAVCVNSDYMQITFFHLGIFLKKLADDQCSSITEGIIYHIKHNVSIQPFTIEIDWPEIGHLMEVSIMFDIYTYCVLLCRAV